MGNILKNYNFTDYILLSNREFYRRKFKANKENRLMKYLNLSDEEADKIFEKIKQEFRNETENI